MLRGCLVIAVSVVLLAAVAGVPATQEAASFRVVDRAEGREIDFDRLVEDVSRAGVVIVTGAPGDTATHRVETQLVTRLAAIRGNGALVLEVFDRQAQESFDHFQMGHLSEAELLAGIERPWPGYLRDYKAVVDLAFAREWTIVAGAPPRPIVEAVAADGLQALDSLAGGERAMVATRHACVDAAEPAAQGLPGPYSHTASCLVAETIAESIAQAYAAGAIGGGEPFVAALVGQGQVSRLMPAITGRIPPGTVVVTVDVVPVDDIRQATLPRESPASGLVVLVQR